MPPSRLHLPRVPARPGEAPDFSYVRLSAAGAIGRPPISARTEQIASLATELVRVLDEQHRAIGPWDPQL
jgi:2-oxoisovalerate dehydrogenase E1 component alpha subunit